MTFVKGCTFWDDYKACTYSQYKLKIEVTLMCLIPIDDKTDSNVQAYLSIKVDYNRALLLTTIEDCSLT